ncbi:DUF2946 domain-containing protein [Janthinobacterium sp. LB2P70]|uniref:DUF2946 domain-containing protein n=1 Tax=Janthinobacterium sp. LB2P70 TaxID=3424197 RepID=UPI003F1ED31E
MPISQRRAVVVLWIACLAIFMAALAPTLSRAFTVASGRAVPSFEICSVAGGMNMLPATLSKDGSDTPTGGMRVGDCPCCSMHAATLDFPPATLVRASGELITGLLPVLFYQSATPLFAWTPVQPRGPPAAF